MNKIKFITSTVPVERSIERLKKSLRDVGCKNFLESWSDTGELTAMIFEDGKGQAFKLESRADAIERAILKTYKKPTDKSRDNARAQANRTAWKLLADKVDCECNLILLDQSDMMESFFAQAYNQISRATFYQLARENFHKMIGSDGD